MPDMDDRVVALMARMAETLSDIYGALENIADSNAASVSDEELARRVLRGQRALARRD